VINGSLRGSEHIFVVSLTDVAQKGQVKWQKLDQRAKANAVTCIVNTFGLSKENAIKGLHTCYATGLNTEQPKRE
jgi:hypothetical protein